MYRILVADDSDEAREEISSLLKTSDLDVEVVLAKDGREAVELIAQESDLDLAIVDYKMPEFNGYEVSKRFRSTPGLKAIPIIIHTTVFNPELKEESGRLGNLLWIMKPLDPDSFVMAIGRMLEKNP